jgi:hypothetical protein
MGQLLHMDANNRPAPITALLLRTVAAAIAQGRTNYLTLERETGVARASIRRFVNGERTLRLDMADRLAGYFDLQLRRSRGGADTQGEVMNSTGTVMHFKGRAAVQEDEVSDTFNWVIGSAVFRGDALIFDWMEDGVAVEGTELKSHDGVSFKGTSRTVSGEDTAKVDGVLYSNAIGHVLVAEAEYQDGSFQAWVVQFIGGIAISTTDGEEQKVTKPARRKKKR